MSSSEHDMSDVSNLESPYSRGSQYSPYSSPTRMVPNLANGFTELRCDDGYTDNKPYLKIIEQPMDYFRFRYRSEMLGTHGCLLGRNSVSGKLKTHPTVELCNYTGSAIIRCNLARHNDATDHPHKLTDEDQDREVFSNVPTQGSYKVGFNGMGIIHSAKKDIPTLLYKKYSQDMEQSEFNERKLRMRCEAETKNINLNIVRLKFTAHDVNSGELLCPPIFSDPIHNMKSAATNDPKICRVSKRFGKAKGGDQVFIFVEKVSKKNIMIRFFELNEDGERVWETFARFLTCDVHHQYGIVFTTPAYRPTSKNVKVFFELLRPSDGRTSEPKEFHYIADFCSREKKRKAESSYSSISSGGSIKSISDLPLTIDFVNQPNKEMEINEIPVLPKISYVPPTPPSNLDVMMGDALLYNVSQPAAPHYESPMLGQPNVPPPPVIQLDSTEMNRLLEDCPHIPSEERKRFLDSDLSEYFRSFDEHLSQPGDIHGMSFIRSASLVADSARPVVRGKCDTKDDPAKKSHESIRNKTEYSAVYSTEDGKEVKMLVRELCEIIKSKNTTKRQILKEKLRRLFDLRLDNGDAFLHMTLCSNQPSLQFIVKLIHDLKITGLLNIQNDRMQTVLHLAIINNRENLIPLLISNGCDPMLEDEEGNNAIHYAVICRTCLVPLLNKIETANVSININAFNYDKQTALHLSAIYGCEKSARLLLKAGAISTVRDSEGRTPLHLAASNTSSGLEVVKCLVEYMKPSDIDTVDGRGHTALQDVCDSLLGPHSLQIAKTLLDNKADPTKCDTSGAMAFKLAKNKPELMQLLRQYATCSEDDIKSEPEDYESADEGEASELSDLSQYVHEVAAMLDRSGGWRELAKRLHRDAMMEFFESTPSPTTTLLNNIKELNDDVTSRSLALLLDDMGEKDAAAIIKSRMIE
ncbi:unnamed protein product [Pieris macdunnoughi]|uniref:RHD domain-containing protein n=1 Tax=Pieris macdunnoughi TaxID=345717 RepID=A0A821Q6N2_9NEOP|nr:unnamed protein product [Pieris macdunnoughi]